MNSETARAMEPSGLLPQPHADAGPIATELDQANCRQLLMSHSLGRVIYTDRALPAGSPVQFSFGSTGLFIHSPVPQGPGMLLGTVVALLVDNADPHDDSGWQVLAVGTCRPFPDPYRRHPPSTPVQQPFDLEIAEPIITGQRIELATSPL
jgi:hypothetical protein